jgi:hypothetical protein
MASFFCPEVWELRNFSGNVCKSSTRSSETSLSLSLSLSLMLRPTVSRSFCLWLKNPSGTYDQNFITVRQFRVCWCRVLCDEWTGLSFEIAAGTRQRSYSRVRVPWDLRPYFPVSDSRLFLFVSSYDSQGYGGVFDPASTRDSETKKVNAHLYCDVTTHC